MELEDALLLGEVIYCRKDEDSYYVGVELEHSLCGLGELSRMIEAFNRATAPFESSAEGTYAVVEGSQQGHKQTR